VIGPVIVSELLCSIDTVVMERMRPFPFDFRRMKTKNRIVNNMHDANVAKHDSVGIVHGDKNDVSDRSRLKQAVMMLSSYR